MAEERLEAVEEALREYGTGIREGREQNQWGDLDASDAPRRVLWDFGVTCDPDEVGHGAMLVTAEHLEALFGIFYGAATDRA
jgi:hypothetical protein